VGWIGCDLDGTLAEYRAGDGIEGIGKPIERMRQRVEAWLEQGHEVRIVTARVAAMFAVDALPAEIHQARHQAQMIAAWCRANIRGAHQLSVTAVKDYEMIELWDDRAVRVIGNTGERVEVYLQQADHREGTTYDDVARVEDKAVVIATCDGTRFAAMDARAARCLAAQLLRASAHLDNAS
jgi:hypothetical protein